MSIRPEVVEALIAAHANTSEPLYALAAAELQFQPPPTAAEKDEARARVVPARNERLERLAKGETDERA